MRGAPQEIRFLHLAALASCLTSQAYVAAYGSPRAMIALEPHVQAVLASTPLDSLSTKSLRTRLESRLGLKSGALKERKHDISRLLTAARDQPAGAPSAAPSAALSAAPPLARLVAPPKRCARRAMFCDCCGALLREPTQTGTSVECHLCGAGVDAAEFEALVVTTAGKDHVLGANLARGGVQADTSASTASSVPRTRHGRGHAPAAMHPRRTTSRAAGPPPLVTARPHSLRRKAWLTRTRRPPARCSASGSLLEPPPACAGQASSCGRQGGVPSVRPPGAAVLHDAAAQRRRGADGFLRVREVRPHVLDKHLTRTSPQAPSQPCRKTPFLPINRVRTM